MLGKLARNLVLLTILLQPLSALAGTAPRLLRGEVRWQGQVELVGPVVVAPGATLTIAAGTVIRVAAAGAGLTVHGRLRVAGTTARPVRFLTPANWRGIVFRRAEKDSVVEHALFAGAATALTGESADFSVHGSRFTRCTTGIKLLRKASARITGCLFVADGIGIDNEIRSAPLIRGNRFRDSRQAAILASHNSRGCIEENSFSGNKVGISLQQLYPDRIVGNRFRRNGTAISCLQTRQTPSISGNSFEGNDVGLSTRSFSSPGVTQNVFRGNRTALRSSQLSSPQVEHNLFADNGTALYSFRKASPEVTANRFEQNDLALRCDYSSYPQVRRNDFLGNRLAVRLGRHQSADWERRAGARSQVQKAAMARRRRSPFFSRMGRSRSGSFVDVRHNWWGRDTSLLAEAGRGANLAIFFDGHDLARVRYPEFGKETYALDRVVFRPWLKGPVPHAGPGANDKKLNLQEAAWKSK